jgi:hypothetical protein
MVYAAGYAFSAVSVHRPVVAAHCPYVLRSLWLVSGATFGVWRRPCLVDYNGSHLARPTAPSHGGAVTFLGYLRRSLCRRGNSLARGGWISPTPKYPKVSWELLVAVLGRAVLGSDMRLYRESKCRGESAVAMSRCSNGSREMVSTGPALEWAQMATWFGLGWLL